MAVASNSALCVCVCVCTWAVDPSSVGTAPAGRHQLLPDWILNIGADARPETIGQDTREGRAQLHQVLPNPKGPREAQAKREKTLVNSFLTIISVYISVCVFVR